jgi:hypothetical protein
MDKKDSETYNLVKMMGMCEFGTKTQIMETVKLDKNQKSRGFWRG